MSNAAGTLESIAIELSKLLRPLESDLVTPAKAKAFFAQMGFMLTDAQATGIAAPLSTTANLAGDLVVTLQALIAAIEAEDYGTITTKSIEAIQKIAQIINALSTVGSQLSGLVGVSTGEVARRLFDYLLFNYLDSAKEINDALELVGLLDREDHNEDSEDPNNPPFTIVTYHFDRISGWFSDPAGQVRTLYDWGNNFDGSKLFSRIESILVRNGLPVIYDVSGAVPRLDIVFLEAVPKTDVTPHGLLIKIKNSISSGPQSIALGSDARIELKIDFQVPSNTGLSIQPNGSIDIVPAAPGSSFSGDFILKVIAERTLPPEPFVLFGKAGSSRLELGKFTLTTGTRVTWDGSRANGDFMIEGDADALKVIVDASNGDGFLATILPGTHIEADFSIQVGISTQHGFYFNGSSALEVQLPTHIELGPIALEALTIVAKLEAGKIPVSVGADIRAALGPIAAVVQNMGVTATFSFPPGNSGNLGPLQFDLGFKPPNGVGLSVNAGIVQGGGFLYIDTDRGEYAGALELVFADFLSLHAIGLITTKMPDGSSGFSLLVIITADFGTGIQLGFGFTLLGVGGLLGLNRIMLLQPLMDGVRTGAINSIMFPQNVVANAPRIISDLRAIFPPQQGIFLIGPMAMLGWGEPTLVSLALGVIIEIPGDIAILGVLKLALPADDVAVIVIQVNFAGAIEFDKKRMYFFASLFDSRVLFITIEGEMGVLFGFGDDANFVVSVGGFHPQYTPPPLPFPSPRRIEIDIINESYARVRCDGYFAVTSDTVQFGAHADMYFGFSALSASGHVGFDALIQFSPFHFVVSFSSSFSVQVFGMGVYGLDIAGTLEGPTPWHFHGTASISFFFFSIDIGIDITWGDSRDTSLPPIAVMPLLASEFGKQSNWRAALPANSHLLVTLRKLGEAEAAFLLHPVGTLRISQRAVPLDLTLDKVGNEKPNDANRFALTVASSGLAKTAELQEQFAPSQFQNFNDATRLSQPGYEPLDSGIELSAAGTSLASGTAITRVVRYDLTVIDTKYRRYAKRFFSQIGALFAHFLGGASVTKCALSAYRAAQMQPVSMKVAVGPETFAVALRSNNTVYSAEAVAFTSQAAAHDYLNRAVAGNPGLAGTLHVLPQFEVAA
jgi:hypothetical protein